MTLIVTEEYQTLFNLEVQRGSATIMLVMVFTKKHREWHYTGETLRTLPGGCLPGRVAPIIVILEGVRKRCYGHGFISPDGDTAYVIVQHVFRSVMEQAVSSDEVAVEVTHV